MGGSHLEEPPFLYSGLCEASSARGLRSVIFRKGRGSPIWITDCWMARGSISGRSIWLMGCLT